MKKELICKDWKVLELASVLAGPSVGMFFAELGAQVIKVENPVTNGDVTRSWNLSSEDSENNSAYFSSINWGKKSISLNYSDSKDFEIVKDLIKWADVIISSFKPGDDKKFCLDFDSCHKLNQEVIYARITAYGPDNPKVGYDAVLQAETGFTYMNGEPDPEGSPVKMPVALIDVLAGHQLKEGILAAMLKKKNCGKGSLVEVSLIDSGLSSLVNQATNYLQAGHIPQRMGSEHPNIAPYGNIFYPKDGKPFVIACGNDRHFKGFCSVIGIPEIGSDPKYLSNSLRVKNRETLVQILREAILKLEREEILKGCAQLNVPAGSVNNLEEAFGLPSAPKLLLKDQEGGHLGVRASVFYLDSDFSESGVSPPPKLDEDRKWILKFLAKENTDINGE